MRESRDSITDVWGERTPHAGQGKWPARVDLRLVEEPDRWVQSCCVLCSNGCALDVGVKDGRIVGVRGRDIDRVNRGRLGPKGLHGWEANASADRLTRPLVRDGDGFRDATWDEAMSQICTKVRETTEQYTADAIAFYSSGQLFLEEYYTLSIISHAGVGTHHLDGNTRLCTATASQALRESFGADGQPCSYSDLDVTDALFLVGSNMAATQTVLWSRVLDRRAGSRPPALVVVDPRKTVTVREADVHLAPRLGTNVAVLNGILRQLIKRGHIDRAFIDRHTVGFERLEWTVRDYVPTHVRHLTGIPAARLEQAAELIGTAPTLVSACLQGVYQSHQATAAACQVNNVNLIRGLIGKPGCGVMQMNGQPTAQNTRETGCDGEFPFFLNWQNPEHVSRWAELWNVDAAKLPHHHTHAHALEIFRHAELGSVKFLWVIGTNPAVSLPELHKVRRTLGKAGLFLVVSDAFLTETARLADVVLPAALWGEKTGAFTNVDRTVHISLKAVDAPGEAKSDLDIFLDFARRMDFRDKAGKPLVKWRDAAGAFDHWARCTRGWLCDYSGLSHAKLTGGSGIQWPCNAEHPDGTERIYTDHVFPTAAGVTQEFGHDIETGAAQSPEFYKANDPGGRAILKAANYIPPREEPDAEYPFFLTTGRVVYQFHARTKTGRAPELNAAAPEAFAEIAAEDAGRLGVKDGDLLEVRSRRGTVYAPAKVGDILPGHVFLPFHYGYWDGNGDGHHRAANELTITDWDPVSKQPYYKFAAVQVRKADGPSLADRATVAGAKVIDRAKELADKALSSAHAPRRRVPDYLGAVRAGHREFAAACRSVKSTHLEEPELQAGLETLARFSDEAERTLEPFAAAHGEHAPREPHRLRQMLFPAARPGPFGVLRDLHALVVLATDVQTATTILCTAAQALRDAGLHDACEHTGEQVRRQIAWLAEHIQHRSGHTLTVPS